MPAGNGWFLFLGSDPRESQGNSVSPGCSPRGVHYCAVEVLTGRPNDRVTSCLIFGPVLFSCGMEMEMLYQLLVTLQDYLPRIGNSIFHLIWVIRGDQVLL